MLSLQLDVNQKRFICLLLLFDRIISMLAPEDSWVARWQRIGSLPVGLTHKKSTVLIK